MTLANKKIKDTYKGVLTINDTNAELTTTLQSVKDGKGNASLLKIATNKVGIADYVFPATDGDAGQVMVTDGNGTVSWVDNSSTVDFAAFNTDIIPDVDNTRSLGSLTKAWKDVFVGPGSFYIDGQEIVKSSSATIFLQADPDQNIHIRAKGTGDIEFSTEAGGSIQFKDVVLFDSTAAIKAAGTTGVIFGDHINMEYQSTKYRIRNLATPVSAEDATTKAYVDSRTFLYTPVNKAGDTMTGVLNMGGNVVSNLGTPVQNTDAATKIYVDNALAGLSWKAVVKAATTSQTTLSGPQTIDGIAVFPGDRVLVKNQTEARLNGIYDVKIGAWTRSTDADNNPGGEMRGGVAVFIQSGNTLAGSAWTITSPTGSITLDSDPIVWTQFAGGPTVTAGDGLDLNGNQLDVDSTVVRTTGNQTIGGVKTFSSNIVGGLTGNATTASALAVARTIAITGAVTGTATAFDGTTNISIAATDLNATNLTTGTIPTARLPSDVVKTSGNQTIDGVKTFNSTITGSITGNAGTATALQTSRNISITGAVTGTATAFNGSADIAINTTGVNASNINSGTIPTARLPLDVVKTSGDQSIDGVKTFNGSIYFNGIPRINPYNSTEYSYLRLGPEGGPRTANLYHNSTTGDVVISVTSGIATNYYAFSKDSGLISNNIVVTRLAGDSRYAQLSAQNTFIENQTISKSAPQFVLNDTSSTNIARIVLQNISGVATNVYYQKLNSSLGLIRDIELDDTQFNFRVGAGSSARTVAIIEDTSSISNYSSTLITREKGDARYAQLYADNFFTGRQRIYGSTPTFDFHETDEAIDSKTWRFIGSGGGMHLQAVNDAYTSATTAYLVNRSSMGITSHNFYIDNTPTASITNTGTSSPNANTIITREKGDARYAQLSASNTFTANNFHKDGIASYYGNANGLRIYHDGTNGGIYNSIGTLVIAQSAAPLYIDMNNDHSIAFRDANSSYANRFTFNIPQGWLGINVNPTVPLQTDNSVGTAGIVNKIKLYSSGDEYGFGISTGSLDIISGDNIQLYANGSAAANFGSTTNTSYRTFHSPEFRISTDGNNAFLAGQLYLRNNAPIIYMRDTDGKSTALHCTNDTFYIGRTAVNDTTVIAAWPLQINLNTGNLSIEGSITGSLFVNSGDQFTRMAQGFTVIRGNSPSIYLRDIDHKGAVVHVNSNQFYILGTSADSETASQVGGTWPLQIDLVNNDTYVGRYAYAQYMNMTHEVTQRTTDTVFYSSYDNFIRKNNAAGMIGSLGLDSRYLLKNPSGSEIISSTINAGLYFTSTSYGTNLKSSHIYKDSSGNIRMRHITDNYASVVHDYVFEYSSTPSFADSVIKRSMGDARYAALSDMALKEDIIDAPEALPILEQLRPVMFKWKNSTTDEQHFGLLAQEVEAVLPGSTKETDAGRALGITDLVGLLVKAVKELSAKVNIQPQSVTSEYVINKSQMFDRMTDEEYTDFEGIINNLSPRKRAVFNNAIMIDSSNELTGEIVMAMIGLYGEERVKELLG